jgi:signal transduction histidine kinase
MRIGGFWTRRTRSGPRSRRAPDPLHRRLENLEAENARAQEILERMDEGVVVFSDTLTPVMANRSARRLLDVRGETLPPLAAPKSVLSIARRALVDRNTLHDIVTVWPGQRRLQVRADPLRDEEGVIVVLKDVTDELRTQEIRRQFVANASHELKSPVASLQALAEAIGEAARDDPDATQRLTTRLLGESERLAQLIADLLDLSRMEDPTNNSSAPLEMSGLVRSVVTEMQPTAEAKGIALRATVAPGVLVRGDRYQLAVLVRNLVDNALRYTPEGGSVTVRLAREDQDVVLRVADNGIGIPLHAQGRVFERFYRVDTARSRERGGTGLGLSIVKHVVELHGGHVGVESELGEGSTFIVRLRALDGTREGSPETDPGSDKG